MKNLSLAVFCLLMLIFGTVESATAKHSGFTHDWLIWMESWWIQHIWLPITWWGFYKYLPDFLCELNLQDNLFDLLGTSLPGIQNETAKAAVKATAAATCKSGFEAQYNNVWYFNDKKKLIEGDWDYYNYTPTTS